MDIVMFPGRDVHWIADGIRSELVSSEQFEIPYEKNMSRSASGGDKRLTQYHQK